MFRRSRYVSPTAPDPPDTRIQALSAKVFSGRVVQALAGEYPYVAARDNLLQAEACRFR
jgi:hypothetical protein